MPLLHLHVDGISVSPSAFDVPIEAGEDVGCSEITFVDNDIALQGNIVFTVRVSIIEPEGVTTITSESAITIVDNDGK